MAANLQNPVMFATQVPVPADFATIGSVFANHMGGMKDVARGGDLWIRYPDGSLRNLTAEAGFGSSGLQGANAIAVRDPAIHFSGTRAVFSMLVGASARQYEYGTWYWQLYEISGFGKGESVTIKRIATQPADTNNVQPTYASDGSIIFVSDRTRTGARHLYPQLDEYESTPTPTGLWKLNPASGALQLLEHAPSGSFTPIVDSFGRVIFTRWDHLQQDQQAESNTYGAFDWSSESAGAGTGAAVDVFPEPRYNSGDSNGHVINQFFPWEVNQDGTALQTLNHVGRHELSVYFSHSFRSDANLRDFAAATAPQRITANSAANWLQIAEDANVPGRFIATHAPEFGTHGSGQIVRIDGAPDRNPEQMSVTFLTAPSTHNAHSGSAPSDFSGHYRDPAPLADGNLVAAVASYPGFASNSGTRAKPGSPYAFRLQLLQQGPDGYLRPRSDGALTSGIHKSVSWYDPDVLVSYDGPLWEMYPVEVRPRPVPPAHGVQTEGSELAALAAAGVDVAAFRQFLVQRGLALLVTRDATSRDRADRQQPYNLRVPGGKASTANGGKLYDIAWMQFFQADQVRGLGGQSTPQRGRRPLARPLHDDAALSAMPAPVQGQPPGSVPIAADGSMAAIIPARRAMSWQSLDPDGNPVVRERYWLSAQPGEIRSCGGCHGVNERDQAGALPASNVPQALVELAAWWREHQDDGGAGGVGDDPLFASGFE